MHTPSVKRERDPEGKTRVLSRWVRVNLARARRLADEALVMYQEDVGPVEGDLVGIERNRGRLPHDRVRPRA